MPSEIEAKLKVGDLEATRQKLKTLGAKADGTRLEINTFFDTPDHTLRLADKGLRLRTRRDLDDGKEDAILTFKGPNQPGPFKNRDEIETRVDDPKATAALLEALGFCRDLSFEKKRESWKLDGCHVELDEVPHLGCFVEIEGPDEKSIAALQQKLGLDGLPAVKTSYIALLVAWLNEHGREERDIRFPKKL
jgi:adenylate cyclase class 2